MSHTMNEDPFSDDEVFFGKLSLKEIKKHIIWSNHLNTKYTCAASNDYDKIKIIQTQSAPNLIQHEDVACGLKRSPSFSPDQNVYSEWEVKPVDDSFLKVEQMVENFCITPDKTVKKEELNNTLDIIDYILNNGAPKNTSSLADKEGKPEIVKNELPKIEVKITDTDVDSGRPIKKQENDLKLETKSGTPIKKHENDLKFGTNSGTPIKKRVNDLKLETNSGTPIKKHVNDLLETNSVHTPSAYYTPSKIEMRLQKTEKFETPTADLKQKTPIFKTPGNPLSVKKQSATSSKKTPLKNNAYQHVASPIASYIKNCPVAPLVKDVRPTKPLPGSSAIPKFVKNPVHKENVNLPAVAYKSAKKTQVITVPDTEKLPQTQLMKKITSTLPKPLIMKHNHREMNLVKRMLSRQEDSFADLSLRQADVSVCTQKSAFNRPK